MVDVFDPGKSPRLLDAELHNFIATVGKCRLSAITNHYIRMRRTKIRRSLQRLREAGKITYINKQWVVCSSVQFTLDSITG